MTVTVNDNGAGEMVATIEYEDDDRVFTNRRVTTLDVTKTVAGNMGDKSRSFTFTASLVGDGITYIKTNADGVIESGDFDTSTGAFTLGHGETMHFANVTYGSDYSITEDTPADYEVSIDGVAEETVDGKTTATGEVEGQTVAFTNTRTSTVPTRVVTPGFPFWVIPAGAGGVVLVVVMRRRKKKAS